MYSPIATNPVSTRASPMGGYLGVNTVVCSGTEALVQKSAAPPNYAGSPMPTWWGVLWHTTSIRRPGHTGTLPHRTYQRSWCKPPPVPTGWRTVLIPSTISGDSGQRRDSHCCQRTSSLQFIWRYPPYWVTGHAPVTMSLSQPGRHWRLDGGAFAPPPFCTFWCRGILPSVSPGVLTYNTACTRGGGLLHSSG